MLIYWVQSKYSGKVIRAIAVADKDEEIAMSDPKNYSDEDDANKQADTAGESAKRDPNAPKNPSAGTKPSEDGKSPDGEAG